MATRQELMAKKQLAMLARQGPRYQDILAKRGISLDDVPAPIPEESPVDAAVPELMAEPEAPWYKKAFRKGVAEPFAKVGELTSEYMVDPWVGTIMSFAYTMTPGDIKGEEAWREAMEEEQAKGGMVNPWTALQTTAETAREEMPWWSVELMGATNPLFWMNPSGVVGKTATGLGALGRTAEAHRLTSAAAMLAKSTRATEQAARGLATAERAVISVPLYPIKKSIGAIPMARGGGMRIQESWARIMEREPGKVRKMLGLYYTKEAQREMAGHYVDDYGHKLLATPMKHEAGFVGVSDTFSLSKKLKMAAEGSPEISNMMPGYEQAFPEYVKNAQTALNETIQFHQAKTGVDILDDLARRYPDPEEYLYNLSEYTKVANAHKTGLVREYWGPTKSGKATGITQKQVDQMSDVELANRATDGMVERASVPQVRKVKGKVLYSGTNPLFRTQQKIKSAFLYPVLLLGRPGWLVYNSMLNFATPAYMLKTKYISGFTKEADNLLTSAGRTQEFAGRTGFGLQSEARELGEIFVEPDKVTRVAYYEKIPLLGKYFKGMQKLSQASERKGHRVLYNGSFLKNFDDELRGQLDALVDNGTMSRELADQCRGAQTIDDAEKLFYNISDVPMEQRFPTHDLAPEIAGMWGTVVKREFPGGLKTTADVARAKELVKIELKEELEDTLERTVLVTGDDTAGSVVDARRLDDALADLKVPVLNKQPHLEASFNNIDEMQRAQMAFYDEVAVDVEQARARVVSKQAAQMLDRYDKQRQAFAKKYLVERMNAGKDFVTELRAAVISGVDAAPALAQYQARAGKAFTRHRKQVRAVADEFVASTKKMNNGRRTHKEVIGLSSFETSEILKKMGMEKLDPNKYRTMVDLFDDVYEQGARQLDNSYDTFTRASITPTAGISPATGQAVRKAYNDAFSVAQSRATMDTQLGLFNYSHVTQLDYIVKHVSPFPFFHERHVLGLASSALNNPKHFALFAALVKSWYEGNKDLPESQRFAATEISIGDNKVLFKPMAWVMPMHGAILQTISIAEGDEQGSDLQEITALLAEFTGGYIYPQLEMAAGVAMPDIAHNRYSAIRDPEEVLKGLIPQWSLGMNLMGTQPTAARELIESPMLTSQQQHHVAYYLGEMADAGIITEAEMQQSVYNLMHNIADDINVDAATKALSRDLPFKALQFMGLPVTNYTPGWQRAELYRRRDQEGVPEGMKAVYAPHYYQERAKEFPGSVVGKYIPPRELTKPLKVEWQSTTDYFHSVDMATEERIQRQFQIDASLQQGYIDGAMYGRLRQQNFQQWAGAVERAKNQYPQANVTREQLDDFQHRLGRTKAPIHPQRAAVDGYFAIDLGESFPPDYAALREARESYLATLEPIDAAYVEWYSLRKATPMEREYKNAVRIMQPYWDIEREVMKNRGFEQVWESLKMNRTQDLAYRKANPGYGAAYAEVLRLRKLIRAAYPEVEEQYQRWYGFGGSVF